MKKINLSPQKKVLFALLYASFNGFYKLKEPFRRLFLLITDAVLITFSVYLVNFLFFPLYQKGFGFYLGNYLTPFLIVNSIVVYYFSGQYASLSRYINSSEIYKIAFRNLVLVVLLLIFESVFNQGLINYRLYILFWIVSTFTIIISRFSLKEIINSIGYLNSNNICRVTIYGAGAAGAQLASSLILGGNHKIIAFFDDDPNLIGRKLLGITIFSPKDIYRFQERADQILLAIPSLKYQRSRAILKEIQKFEIPVLKVPSIESLTNGKASIDSLRPIEVEDLLGRGIVSPYKELLRESVKDLNICVTGAGGSIGQELCKQILDNHPRSLVMIDSSELNLYQLEQELSLEFLNDKNLLCKFVLGDLKDLSLTKNVFQKYSIDVVYHAAAYKHVPLIEKNPLQGIQNNVFSTLSICKAAEQASLKQVTLISTDKAVRPSNVMGASKRLSELILQAYSEKNKNLKITNNGTINHDIQYSIVRFGNVLNSSGSVVPLFKKQIESGGPITLTHKDVIRFFMTISEAAQLVIQSSSLTGSGEVFLLDMGEPVRIYDLAKQMIRLSGLSLKDSSNPDGDIEIKITGLRPGEKLFEELLIDAESEPTKHPLIFKAVEDFIPYKVLEKKLNLLDEFIERQDIEQALEILHETVPQWHRSSKSESF